MYLRVAAANSNCNSVFTLTFDTPKEIAFLTCSSGIPEPPCNTSGLPFVAVLISSKRSKLNPAQLAGYLLFLIFYLTLIEKFKVIELLEKL